MKNSQKIKTTTKYALLVLMLVVFALQFVPNWDGVSVAKFLAFPEKVTQTIKSIVSGNINIDDIVVYVVCQLVGSLIGFIIYLKKNPGAFAGLIPVIAGGAGVLGGLLSPIYQGGSLWLPLLAVSALLLIVGVINLTVCVIRVLVGED